MNRILERRARFIAAATMFGAAVTDVACEAQSCLSVPVGCASDPEPRATVEGPSKVCVGDRVDLRYIHFYCGQRTDGTKDARFTTSDPSVLSAENRVTFLAVGTGRVTVTGQFVDGSGPPATLEIEVTACADAASDAASDD